MAGPAARPDAVPSALLELLERSRSLGFLGPGSVAGHVEHALGFDRALSWAGAPSPASAVDLGSGGGVPGLVLAWRWADAVMVLLDSSARRSDFLAEAVGRLGWSGRVHVVRDRAEVAGRVEGLRGSADVVVARSFGPPPVTAECAAPFLRAGGWLVVSEPPEVEARSIPDSREVLRWPEAPLAELGIVPVGRYRDRFGYQVLRQLLPCPERYPRRVGVPAKRPLYSVPDGAEA